MTKEKQFVREKESPLALGSLTHKKMVALCNGQTEKKESNRNKNNKKKTITLIIKYWAKEMERGDDKWMRKK